MLKIKQKENTNDIQTVNLKTINGDKKTRGMVTLKIKIYDIEKTMDIFVIDNENFHYDFLIGLDCIKDFKLMQDEKLNILQCNNPEKKKKFLREENIKNIPNISKQTNVEIPKALGDKNENVFLHSEVQKQDNNYEINFNEHINVDEFEKSVNHLDLRKQTEIDKVIEKHKSLFAKDITMIFTAVDAPFSNGLNERLNQTLVNKIRCKINEGENKKTWTTIAKECVEKYNETEHTVTKFAPKYLLEGDNVNILPPELKTISTKQNLEKDRKLAFENTIKSHNYNKNRFDQDREEYEFNIGDKVYIENGNRLNRKKMDELRIGPYKILRKISNSIYEIDTGHKKAESNLYHITKLSPVLVDT